MKNNKVILGTRGSRLALAQAQMVKEELEAVQPDLTVEFQVIKTKGDSRHDLEPAEFEEEGIFTAELDRALQEEKIDIAVHSLKDLPTRLGKGLVIAATLERGAATDTLILHRERAKALQNMVQNGGKITLTRELFAEVLPDLVIGTSSLRRRAFLKHLWHSLSFVPLRGNLDTRLRKLENREVDAIVVATTGLHRLLVPTHGHWFFNLEFPTYLPAPGQGAIALETRSKGETRELASLLNHPSTFMATAAERRAMARLGAGCRVPVGFFGQIDGITLTLKGAVASPDGQTLITAEVEGEDVSYDDLGWRLAEELKEQGADEILREVRK